MAAARSNFFSWQQALCRQLYDSWRQRKCPKVIPCGASWSCCGPASAPRTGSGTQPHTAWPGVAAAPRPQRPGRASFFLTLVVPNYFYFFSLLLLLLFQIILARSSRIMLNSRGESKHLRLLPDFKENVSNISSLSITCAIYSVETL